MGEQTMRSPGTSTREIDQSQPRRALPVGTPAGVIGTAAAGPAFVPVTVASFSDFVATFGKAAGRFGPLALSEWLKNSQAGTFLKILGIGDGKRRLADTLGDTAGGGVARAGFVVGAQQVQANGIVGQNQFTLPNDAGGNDGAASATDVVVTTGVVDLDRIRISVPVDAGGSGVEFFVDFRSAAIADPPDGIIHVFTNANTANDAAANLILAINGTADQAKVRYGAGTGTSTGGIAGITAAPGTAGPDVTVTATLSGPAGNDISFVNIQGALAQAVPFSGGATRNPGILGRTYFLGCFMSSSAGSTIFQEAGIRPGSDSDGIASAPAVTLSSDTQKISSGSHPILRGIIMAPSGVMISLNSSAMGNNRVQEDQRAKGEFGTFGNEKDAGGVFGSANGTGNLDFVMLLNGHDPTKGKRGNVITASFDPTAGNYIGEVLNTDPLEYEREGHLLYSHYPVYPNYAVVTGSGLLSTTAGGPAAAGSSAPAGASNVYQRAEQAIFMVTSSLDRNVGSAAIPNFEGFRDRFRHASSPFFISQKFGGKAKNLFRLHALDAGSLGNNFKISIENITRPRNDDVPFGTFDLVIRDIRDSDREKVELRRFSGLSLDPNSEQYIARQIGDTNIFFDFDKDPAGQKIVVEGAYPATNPYVRVEMDAEVDSGEAPPEALPVGFRGPKHLVTSGSGIVAGATLTSVSQGVATGYISADEPIISSDDIMRRLVQPPIPMRSNISVGVPPKNKVDPKLYWGVQFEQKDDLSLPNKNSKFETGILSLMKYHPMYATTTQPVWAGDNEGVADVGGTVLDADRFNNNMFTLERILVKTQSDDTPDPKEWSNAVYQRDGNFPAGTAYSGFRFFDVRKDIRTSVNFAKFSVFMQGGFDGLNIFDKEKFEMSDVAIKREMEDSTSQGGTSGPTVAAYRKAVDVMSEKSDVDIQILAIPGIRNDAVTDFAIDAVEDRFDAIYIMDIEGRDQLNNVVTSSITQRFSVTNTANAFRSRNLDSSFAAAYFPDLVMIDPDGAEQQVPASVGVLGAFSKNDSLAHPWFAPAGFARGSMNSVIDTAVKLNRDNMDSLYDVDINPITSFPQSPDVVVFGQKTLQAADSALDRVNVRRLLIDVRRKVKTVANSILFEPNRESTLARFSAAVDPILATIQAQQGVDRFKVVIDTSTTTQIDVENNTVRGKIFLQPTRSVEFISLDFVVTNAGADI